MGTIMLNVGFLVKMEVLVKKVLNKKTRTLPIFLTGQKASIGQALSTVYAHQDILEYLANIKWKNAAMENMYVFMDLHVPEMRMNSVAIASRRN